MVAVIQQMNHYDQRYSCFSHTVRYTSLSFGDGWWQIQSIYIITPNSQKSLQINSWLILTFLLCFWVCFHLENSSLFPPHLKCYQKYKIFPGWKITIAQRGHNTKHISTYMYCISRNNHKKINGSSLYRFQFFCKTIK